MVSISNQTVVVVLSVLMSACASPPKGALLGSVAGGAAGFAIGSQFSSGRNQRQGPATGLLVGALLGGALGYLASVNKFNRGQVPDLSPLKTETIPLLKRPEVRKIWVPDQIVGDEFIGGHWKFIIEKNAVWTKEK